MKVKKLLAGLLCLILILNASPIYVSSSAVSTRGVTSTYSVAAYGNTFTISRNTSGTVEAVRYRTVGLTALPGIHFTAAEGTLTFEADETSKQVTVTETAVENVPVQYRYQTGTSREYGFEVLDMAGFLLAETTRGISYGSSYKFSNTYVNSSVTDLIYLNCSSGQNFRSNTSYYTDVAYSASTNNPIRVKDTGYKQAVHTVSTSALYTHTGGIPADYFAAVGDDMYVTVGYTVQEVKDGYDYIQILADNDTTYDGNDSNGTVSNPSTSLYKACYEIDKTSTTPQTSDRKFYFPHRYDYKNRDDGNQAVTWTEFSDDKGYLYKQAFKDDSYRASNSGSIIVSPSVGNINIRFDAAGKDSDDWDFKNLFVRLALADTKAPTVKEVYFTHNPPVKRSRITVSVVFSEIVNASGTVLHTTWGDLTVRQNSSNLSNVVPYSGYITAEPGAKFRINSLEGTVKDLKGYTFSGSLSKLYTTEVAALQTPASTSAGYMISCISDFYWYAERVGNQPNLPATLTNDIIIPNASMPGIYSMGGTNGFSGTFNGGGHKIKNLAVNPPNAQYSGLFSRILTGGTVRDLTVENADISATTPSMVGGICGENNGTVENCLFSGKVTAAAASGYPDGSGYALGGICGNNTGTVRNSMAINRTNTVLLSNKWTNMNVGGVAGKNSGNIESCLFYGLYYENSHTNITRGAVVGSNTGNISNCAGVHNNSNYFSYAIGSDTGNSYNTEFLEMSEFPNGHACYILNDGVTDGTQTWYQTIDTDDFPELSGGTVYKHGNNYVNEVVHRYTDINWVWSPDYTSATAYLKCMDCEATAQVQAAVTVRMLHDRFIYTATADYNDQSFTKEVIIGDYYNITFKNYDGETLAEVSTADGVLPVYPDNTTPEKPSDEYYVYTFNGWDPPLAAATEDAVYTAQYEASVRYYTINFYDDDGTLLQSDQYTYGDRAIFPTPHKDSDELYDYELLGWGDTSTNCYTGSVEVYSDKDYYAMYTGSARYYNIRFVDEDGDELFSFGYLYGDTPEYLEETPTKSDSLGYSFAFAGWVPELGQVTEDVTYRANFTATYNGSDQLYESNGYQYTVDGDGNAKIVGYTGSGSWLDISGTLGGRKVIGIGPYAFRGNTGSGSWLDIPGTLDGHTVISIGPYAFRGNTDIVGVEIPDSVIVLDEEAFFGCASLVYVGTGSNLKNFGNGAFKLCPKLETFEYGSSGAPSFSQQVFEGDELVVIYAEHRLRLHFESLGYPFIGTDEHNSMVWTWNGTESASLHVVCSGCDIEEQTVDADIETFVQTPATCTSPGVQTVRATAECGHRTFTDEKTVEISALGHDWGEPEWTWNGNALATAVFTCGNDVNHDHIYQKTASVSRTVTQAGTVYTATATGPDGKTYEDKKYNFASLSLGKNTVSIPYYEDASAEVWFVPSETGRYRFYSRGDEDTAIEIYYGSNEFITNDENSGEICNFDVCCDMIKDKAYLLRLRSYYDEAAVDVYIEKTVIGETSFVSDETSLSGTVKVDLRNIQLTNGVAAAAAYDEWGTLLETRVIPLTNNTLNTLELNVDAQGILYELKLIIFENYATLKPFCKSMFIHKYDENPLSPDDPPEDDPEDPPEDPPEDDYPPDDE